MSTAAKASGLEVHEHHYIAGPRANRPGSKFSHSHEGGHESHVHPDTGPSVFTIDAKEWFASTGLRGGGKKQFTKKPTGEQLETITRKPEPFRVIFVEGAETPASMGEGPGAALPLRIASTFRKPFTVETIPLRRRAAK